VGRSIRDDDDLEQCILKDTIAAKQAICPVCGVVWLASLSEEDFHDGAADNPFLYCAQTASMSALKKPEILRVTVDFLDGSKWVEDLGAQLTPLEPDLQGMNLALEEAPGRFAWWGMLEARARGAFDDLEAQVKVLDAELFNQYFQTLNGGFMSGGQPKPPTLDAIRSAITLDSRMQVLQARLRKAKLDLDQITVGRRTMDQRKDTLLAIASNWRAEMEYRRLQVKERSLPGARAGQPPPTTM